MKRLILAAALSCALCLPAFSSTSNVTATLQDPDGTVWSNCTWTAILNSPVPPTIAGVPVPNASTRANGTCNSSGVTTATILDTGSVQQNGVTWTFTIQPNASVPPSVVSGVSVTGATVNLSTVLSSGLTVPRFGAGPNAYGYVDGEINSSSLGNTYFNTGTVCGGPGMRQLSLAGWTCGGGGGNSSPITPPIAGALADYLAVSGSGTTLTDISGNSNNGTFAASAPTWATQGLKFSVGQGVELPATVNTARTQVFGVYLNSLDFPVVGGATTSVGTYQTLLTSSTGATGDNALYALYENSNFQGAAENFAPSTYSNSAPGTACHTLIAGFNVIIRTTGTNSSTDPDHYYINGTECQTYNVHTASAAFQAAVGNYYIGAPPTGIFSATSGLTGTLYRAAFIASEITAAQAATISAQVTASIQALGVALTQPAYVMGGPQLLAGVDSITYGYTTANPPLDNWAANLTLTNQPAYIVTNYGITGSFISANSANAINREGRLCQSARGPSVEIIFGGTNDIAGLFTPATTFAALAAMVKTEKEAGCVVGVGTMISRTGTNVDTNKDTYDNLILTGWKQIGADFVVDFAANPLMGADGANTNRTYFFTDGIHPTIAGQLLLASAASNSLNWFFGSKLGSPSVVTATTYQMLSGDGVITAAPTANAAYTLPDCTGPSGSDYIISNPQSAFTLSVIGATSQPINGIATAITISSNSTVTLHDVANPKSTSGCHWAM